MKPLFILSYLTVGAFWASMFHLGAFRVRSGDGKLVKGYEKLAVVLAISLAWPALFILPIKWVDE
jgi:hypothetical protein